MTFKDDLLKLCLECGAKCCKHAGSPMVLPNEKERIVKATGRDVFKKQGNYYLIPDNPCPFLENNKCSIHDIKPLDCKIYPCSVIKDGKIGISKLCPVNDLVDGEFISEAEKIVDNLTPEQKEDLHKLNVAAGWEVK